MFRVINASVSFPRVRRAVSDGAIACAYLMTLHSLLRFELHTIVPTISGEFEEREKT